MTRSLARWSRRIRLKAPLPQAICDVPASHVPGHCRLQSTSTASTLPLAGLRILDFTRVLAGPYCTQILADYGASVLKIEQPASGDETRQWRTSGEGQKWRDSDDPKYKLMSLYFAAVNRNKRSLTLNLKDDRAKGIVKQLINQGWRDGDEETKPADVVVHNFLPGKMEQLGLGYGDLKTEGTAGERLIYAAVSGYGPSGPSAKRAGYDAIALAEAGLLHITGEERGRPVKPGVAMADLCTGLYTHGAILAALRQRDRTGKGCLIEGSLFESSLSLLINVGLASMNLDVDKGPEKRRRGKRLGLGHPNLVPYGGFETKDGKMLFVAANNNRQWKGFCDRMNIPGLGADNRFNTNDGRVDNREEIDRILQKRFREKTKEEWLANFEGSGLPYGAINDPVEALEGDQAGARNMVMEIDDFEAAQDGVLKMIGPAIKFSGTQMRVKVKPPLLGEHTDQVLDELGYRPSDVQDLRAAGVV
jgi:succinate---hydroxymethylglutarate CoA-transferase